MSTRSISSGCWNRNVNWLEMTLFFEFLQVAMGTRKSLSCDIKDADWQRLFDFCKRQALIGVGFTAVEKLNAVGVVCPTAIRMKWMALALQIERQNEKITNQCGELTKKYEHDGLQCCILKGQGNLQNYPEELRLRRMPGDIDVWCIPPKEGLDIAVATGNKDVEYVSYKGRSAIIEYVKLQYRLSGIDKQPIAIYHHIVAPPFDGTEVEVHFKPSFCSSVLRNRRMQKWFSDHAYECTKNYCLYGFPVPTSSVNVVYQMCHIYNHYIYEGIGLRQLMDYYYTLRIWHNDWEEKKELESRSILSEGIGNSVKSPDEVMAVLRSFGMTKFTAAVMYVLKEVFAMPAPYYTCEPNEKEGKMLLAEMINIGNFGHYDSEKPNVYQHRFQYHIWKFKRIFRLAMSYPEEALWEPVFRVWRKMIDE